MAGTRIPRPRGSRVALKSAAAVAPHYFHLPGLVGRFTSDNDDLDLVCKSTNKHLSFNRIHETLLAINMD